MRKHVMAILVVVMMITGCTTATGSTITKVTPQQAIQLIEEKADLVFIDVRTLEEYQSGYVQGSILLPLDTVESSISTVVQSQDTPILIICRSGNRSNQAAQILHKLGYTEIYDVGGIIDWPYPTTRP